MAEGEPPRVFVAGHRGMVGSAIVRKLEQDDKADILTVSRSELDLCDSRKVDQLLNDNSVDQIYLCAAKVGGIQANHNYPAEFIFENLTIQNNVINAAYKSKTKRMLFLGSSCIYPRLADQPMNEQALLSAELEKTNESYAIAKIAGIKMCEAYNRQYGTDFRAVMPTNLYGANDNFHPHNSHVVPALLRRFHEAKVNGDGEVTIWGSGTPLREFLHVDDMAEACVFVMGLDRDMVYLSDDSLPLHINVGSGNEVTIQNLAELIGEIVGFQGEILFDPSKPDGTPRKLLDVSRLSNLGWQSSIGLREGLEKTYSWYLENEERLRT